MARTYNRSVWSIIIVPVIVLGLAAAVYILQIRMDKIHPQSDKIEDLMYLPSGKFLKGAALGYDELLADLLWIKAIGYFGGHAITDQNYDWLYHILDITTTLDPLFDDPYEFGGIVFANEVGDVDSSIKLLDKGMKNVPTHHWRYWYLPFFQSFNYMYYKNDYKMAARYLEIAAKYPGRPDYLPLLVSRLYANAGDPEVAIAFLKEMINSTESDELKERLEKRIKEVMADRDIRMLEKVRDRFYEIHGRYPEDTDELVKSSLISSLPKEPFGGKYRISPVDHSIYSTTMGEKLILHIDKKKSGLDPKIQIVPKK